MPQIQIYTRPAPSNPKILFAACTITCALTAIAILAMQWGQSKPIQNATKTPPKSPFYLFGTYFDSLEKLRDHVQSDAYTPAETNTDIDQFIEYYHAFITPENQHIFEDIILKALDKGSSFHNQHIYRSIPNRPSVFDAMLDEDEPYSDVKMDSVLWLSTALGEKFCTKLIQHTSCQADYRDIEDLLMSHLEEPIDVKVLTSMVKALLDKPVDVLYRKVKQALVAAAQIDTSLFKLIHEKIVDCPNDFIQNLVQKLTPDQLIKLIDSYQEVYDLSFFEQICSANVSLEVACQLLKKTPAVGVQYPQFVDAASKNISLLQAVFEHGSGSEKDFEALENWAGQQRYVPKGYFQALAILVRKCSTIPDSQIEKIVPRLRDTDADLIKGIISKSKLEILTDKVAQRLLDDEEIDTELIQHFKELPLIGACFDKNQIDPSLILALLECKVSTSNFLYGKAFDQISVDNWDDMLKMLQQLQEVAYPSSDFRYLLDVSLLDTSGAFTEVTPGAYAQSKDNHHSRFAVLRHIDTLPMYEDLKTVEETTKKVIEKKPDDLSLAEILHMTHYDERILNHVLSAMPESEPIVKQFRHIQTALKENSFPELTLPYEDLQWVIPALSKPTMEQIASISDADVVCAILNECDTSPSLVKYLSWTTKHEGRRLQVVKKLIENGAQLDEKNEAGLAPIIVALHSLSQFPRDDAAIIAHLISLGASLESHANQLQSDNELWELLTEESQKPQTMITIAFLKPYIDKAQLGEDPLSKCFKYEDLTLEQYKILIKISEFLPKSAKPPRSKGPLVPSKSVINLIRQQRKNS